MSNNEQNKNVAPIDTSKTMEISNDALLELMKTYLTEKTPEALNKLIMHIVKCRVLTPANLNKDKKPIPVFIKNPNDEIFIPIYTDKEQIPKNPGAPLMINMPYLDVNQMAANPNVAAQGIVINPFTTNLVFKEPLVLKIEEVEKKKKENPTPEVKTVKMTEEQYVLFERKQFEALFLPKKVFTEGETFTAEIAEKKESYIDQLFEESYQQKRMYPYLEEDFAVMVMNIDDTLQMIRIDLPIRDCPPGACVRVYVAWNPVSKAGRYFTVEKTASRDEMKLCEITSEWKHEEHGNTLGEGAELQQIIDLYRMSDEMTS